MDRLKTIVYVSSASAAMRAEDLAVQLIQWRTRNFQRGISGALLYCDGDIMQAIEGPEHEVDALFARISRDPRHSTLLVLYEDQPDSREFESWPMGFGRTLAHAERDLLPAQPESIDAKGAPRTPTPSGTVRPLLESFHHGLPRGGK